MSIGESSMAFNQGVTFFLISIAGSLMYRQLRKTIRTSKLFSGSVRSFTNTSGKGDSETEYKETLQNLFRAVKSTSRHRPTDPQQGNANLAAAKITKTNEDLFAERQKFFSKLALDSQMIRDQTRVIHIAGSKGKGSVVEYLSTALRSNNKKVGIFTSPHLHTARERIKINREMISKEDLTRIGKANLASMFNFNWTVFFDLFLASAIQYFGEQAVDYVILETGIGGRYDSTNFVQKVDIGVITSISYDHTQVLGETLTLIAWQKAGIIKRGMHVFTPSTQAAEALVVIQQQCKDMQAHLHVVDITDSELKKALGNEEVKIFDVQVENACVALAVAKHMQLTPSSKKKMLQEYANM